MDATDVEQFAKDLLKHGDRGKLLRKRLGQRMREGVKPVVPALRASALAIPSKRGRSNQSRSRRGNASGSLRIAIAKATQVKVGYSGRNVGARVRVDASKLPEGQQLLPKLMDGVAGPWRHPLFGDSEHWYAQEPHPYFRDVAYRFAPYVHYHLQKAIDDTLRDLARER